MLSLIFHMHSGYAGACAAGGGSDDDDDILNPKIQCIYEFKLSLNFYSLNIDTRDFSLYIGISVWHWYVRF